MNEYTGPELEGEEVALLDLLRDTQGPTPGQEDRMLARLRAQIEVEAEVRGATTESFSDDAEPTVAEASTEPRPWRTTAVGVLAFAAGVALTWGLRDDAPTPSPAPAEVADAADASVGRHAPSGVRAPTPPPSPFAPTEQGKQREQSPTGDTLPTPPLPSLTGAVEDDVDETATHMAERFADPKADSGSDPTDSPPAPSGEPNGARRDHRPQTRPSPGRREPNGSGSGSAAPASVTPPSAVGPVELVGGAPSAMGRPFVPSAGGSGPASAAPSQAPGPTSEPAKPEPSDPEPDNPPEPEEPEEPDGPDEPEPPHGDEACLDAHMVCLEAADLMCSYDIEGCERFFSFCDFSMEVCLAGGEPPPDYDPDLDPDGPPDESGPCAAQLEMCLSEIDNVCNEADGLTPEECMDMEWQCHDAHAVCEGYDPPPPPSEW